MKKKTKLLWPGIILIFLVVVGILLVWLYTGKITSAKNAVYKATGLPALFVNSYGIPLSELTQRQAVMKALPGATGVPTSDLKKTLITKLIADKEIDILANAHQVKVDSKDIDLLYKQIAEEFTGGDVGKLDASIKSYGDLDRKIFQNEVLRSALVEQGLKAWYYGQRDLNKAMYQTADKILEAAKNGEDFTGLASHYSQDNATALFQGDSGFIDVNQLSPAVSDGIKGAKQDEIRAVPGPEGLHLLKLLAHDKDAVRLQHIYLPGTGFDIWLTGEMKKFKVINLTGKLSWD